MMVRLVEPVTADVELRPSSTSSKFHEHNDIWMENGAVSRELIQMT